MITFGFLCLYWSRVIVRELCIIQSFYFIIIDEIEVSGVSVGCGDNHWWRRQPPRYDTERATFIRNGGELTQQSRSYITIPVISGLYRRPDQTQHLLHIRRCHRRRLCNIWLACSNVGRWVRPSEWVRKNGVIVCDEVQPNPSTHKMLNLTIASTSSSSWSQILLFDHHHLLLMLNDDARGQGTRSILRLFIQVTSKV